MSDILSWAENEVRIASAKERGNAPEDEWDYGVACYESALKAYKSLCEDGHSGFSFSITRSILNRLMNDLPLTPIKDTEDCWNLIYSYDDKKTFQCKRMFSLFKDVYENGDIKYHDNNRVRCRDIGTDAVYHSGLVSNIWDELYPITMPYFPDGKSVDIYCETFLSDENNDCDFDTKGVLYAVTSDGEKIEINRYFKDSISKTGYDEIDFLEYMQRKGTKIK